MGNRKHEIISDAPVVSNGNSIQSDDKTKVSNFMKSSKCKDDYNSTQGFDYQSNAQIVGSSQKSSCAIIHGLQEIKPSSCKINCKSIHRTRGRRGFNKTVKNARENRLQKQINSNSELCTSHCGTNDLIKVERGNTVKRSSEHQTHCDAENENMVVIVENRKQNGKVATQTSHDQIFKIPTPSPSRHPRSDEHSSLRLKYRQSKLLKIPEWQERPSALVKECSPDHSSYVSTLDPDCESSSDLTNNRLKEHTIDDPFEFKVDKSEVKVLIEKPFQLTNQSRKRTIDQSNPKTKMPSCKKSMMSTRCAFDDTEIEVWQPNERDFLTLLPKKKKKRRQRLNTMLPDPTPSLQVLAQTISAPVWQYDREKMSKDV